MAYDDDEDEGYDKPVEEGKTYTVKVEDLGSKGDGIARVEGFVVFVPETEVGETVRVEVNSVGRKFAFAEVVDRDVDESELDTDEDERYEKEEVDEDELDEMDDVEEETDEDEDELDTDDEQEEEDDERYEKEETDEDDRYDKEEVDEDEDELDEEDLDAPATEEELENDLGVDDEQMRRPDEL